MRIYSPAFLEGAPIPRNYTCDGQRVNPPLRFSDVPPGARSLVLIMDDIDATDQPDGIWNHWLLWNIPAGTREIAEASTPPGISGHTTGGETEYQPPCPPQGEHRYVFRLYALETMLELDYERTRRADILRAMEGHVLDSAELQGRYSRGAVREAGGGPSTTNQR